MGIVAEVVQAVVAAIVVIIAEVEVKVFRLIDQLGPTFHSKPPPTVQPVTKLSLLLPLKIIQ